MEPTVGYITSPAQSAHKRANILSAMLSVISIGVITGLIFTMMMTETYDSCPDELIGTWKTNAPGYEDGMLVFTNKAVLFSAGGEHLDGQAVRRLQAAPDGPRTLYTITYGDSRSEEQTLSFYYHTRDRTITFKNQANLVWTRTSVES
ncbi:MAG: hypothetical protein ABL970_16350 [Nitrospira sp.]